MSYWTLLQVVFNLFVFAALVATWWRLRRPPQDDPRLSRGLQLLQTKITVLEDLSDRTDAQVKQLTTLIDQKTRALQNKVIEAEQQIVKIDHSVSQSVAISSPTITDESESETLPSHELMERERTVAYVKAAKMANSGCSVSEIATQVNLPLEQIELIAKFNRDQLMFDESQLPDWAQREGGSSFSLNGIDFVGSLDNKPTPDLSEMAKIEKNFKQAVNEVKKADQAATQSLLETRIAESIRASMASGMASVNSGFDTVQPAVMAVRATAQTLKEKLVATAEDMLKHNQAHMRAGGFAPVQTHAPTPTTIGSGNVKNTSPTPLSKDDVEKRAATISESAALVQTGSSKVQRVIPAAEAGEISAVGAAAYANAVFKPEAPKVRKVVFPRIDKPN